MKYNYTKKINLNFQELIPLLKEALQTEGFGVLTEIDLKAVMKKKLDIEYDNYVILGACNPGFADKALQTEYEIGLMLPCNIIAYEKDKTVFVSAIMPTVAMGMIENKELQNIAKEVEIKLKSVIDSLCTTEEKDIFFTCKACAMKYKDKEWADRCEAWCNENHSCNLDIIKHAEK